MAREPVDSLLGVVKGMGGSEEYIERLGKKYSHCRFTQPGNNSLYHAIAYYLTDLFTHSQCPRPIFELFYKRIFYTELFIPIDPYVAQYATVLEVLWQLYELILARNWSKLREMGSRLITCAEYIQCFTQVLRCLAYSGIVVLKPSEAYSSDAEEECRGMMSMTDRKVETVDIWGLSAALDMHIIVEDMNRENTIEYQSVRPGEQKPRIYLAGKGRDQEVFRIEEYCALYPVGWAGEEGGDVEKARFEELLLRSS